MLLADKVAVVTGVGPGLGRAAAVALAREGAAVGLVARTESRLQEVAKDIESAGGRVITPRKDIGPNMGAFAVFADPVGNDFGLYEEPPKP